ncbi:MAG: protein translocase subunit SecD [Oscillospiraceae bacterium]|jgi:protein-export membrane protein SecD
MKKSIISFLLIIAVIALLLFTALNGLTLGTLRIPGVKDGVTLGLELVGGSEITYEAEIPEGTPGDDIETGMQAAQAMLRQRLDSLGYTEASVFLSGSNRIIVDIPSVENPEEAVQMIGATAVVQFRDAEGNVLMDATGIKSATARNSVVDESGIPQYHVVLEFTEEGRKAFKEATKEVANRTDGTNYLSIYLDENEISRPYVSTAEYSATGIDSDSALITFGSNATKENTKYLADLISAGSLPFTLRDAKLQSVGASLGEKSLNSSILAGVIGIAIVMLFMIIMYRIPGLASSIALAFYAGLFLVILSITHLNLSLPGIAGVILSIGMAVDANCIIFERIQEELRAGKTIRSSIDTGFHNAFSAILDSNVTTVIAAAVLWWQGTGTIIGFAKTLIIGVVVSMFTMLVITRILLKCLFAFGIKSKRAYGV